MDALSLAASITGLVALADLVFRDGIKYIRGVKHAHRDIQDLLSEVKNVSLLLHNLSLVVFSLEDEFPDEKHSNETTVFQLHYLHECQLLLRRLENGLSEPNNTMGKLHYRMTWPFSSSEIHDMLAQLQRHKQTIGLALGAESARQLKMYLSKQDEISSRVSGIQQASKKLLDIQTNIRLDKQRRKVLELFSKSNPRPEFEANQRLRHPLTGLWLTQGSEFEEWYAIPNSMAWFTGIPGAGKSVLAAAAVSECLLRNGSDPKKAVAYFFCMYRDEKTHEATNILSSLALQLALQNEDAYDVLEAYHNELRLDSDLPGDPTADGLIDVLNSMVVSFDQVCFVVDGLDECGEQVSSCMRRLLSLTKIVNHKAINMALFSRDELPIRRQLEQQFACIELEAHTEDIQRYVATELENRISSGILKIRNIKLKDDILKELVSGSKGMFRWVACQLDHLCDLPSDRARREALHKLPPTLPATYERILMRVETYPENERRLVQRTLQLISSPRPLSVTKFCQALSLSENTNYLEEEDIVEEDEIFQWCGSLIRKVNETIVYAHYTVQEFLRNICPKHPQLKVYGVSDESSQNLVAVLSLQYVNLKNYEQTVHETRTETSGGNIPHLQSFYEHAAMYWPRYVHNTKRDDQITEGLQKIFQVQKTGQFCNWAAEFVRHCVVDDGRFRFECALVRENIANEVNRPDFTCLHMAAALGLTDICANLLQKGAKLELRSRYGTPLQFAIGSLAVFGDYDVTEMLFQSLQPVLSTFLSGASRQQTVKLLLDKGGGLNLQVHNPFCRASAFYLFLSSPIDSDDFQTMADLLNSKIGVDETDVESLKLALGYRREFLRQERAPAQLHSEKPLEGLLKALETSRDKSSVHANMYATAFKFASSIRSNVQQEFKRPWPEENASEGVFREFIASVIEDNDVDNLQLILDGNRSGLIHSIGFESYDPGWTALHIAVKCESLDALNMLLDAGCDPNKVAKMGSTPLHCFDNNLEVDIVRALLKYGSSTIILDKNNETFWHICARSNLFYILRILLELDERTQALDMVSNRNETPILAALKNSSHEAAEILLEYCNSEECWKPEPRAFRAAAIFGSEKFLQKLLDVGVEMDAIDDHTGNPLHFLHVESTFHFIRLLKAHFSVEQRRETDNKIPFQLFISQAIEKGVEPPIDSLKELLPPTILSNPQDAADLWRFMSLEVLGNGLKSDLGPVWLDPIFEYLLEIGLPKSYEEIDGKSSSSPVIEACCKAIDIRFVYLEKRRCWGISPKLELSPHWDWMTKLVVSVAHHAETGSSMAEDGWVITFMSEAVIHNDLKMIKFWTDMGVSIHTTNLLSPIEFACFPQVVLSEENFDFILSISEDDKLNLLNKDFRGGLLSFTSGQKVVEGSVWKLQRLLQKGVDCKVLGSKKDWPLLVTHIFSRSIRTAEILLDHGADPWGSDTTQWNAPLAAVYMFSNSFLEALMESSKPADNDLTWGRTLKVEANEVFIQNGNALHVAALANNVEALTLYFERGLLTNLEAADDDGCTPMHYAAVGDSTLALKYLAAHGANINAKSLVGRTPLHVAVSLKQQNAVETLLELGAGQISCAMGLTPLNLAHQQGDSSLISMLNVSRHNRNPGDVDNPRERLLLAGSLTAAIANDDLDACKRIFELGCPIDIELDAPFYVTPLMAAITRNKRIELIQWLLENGATVSTTFPAHPSKGYETALHAASAQPRLNPLLSALTRKYVDEGATFAELKPSPLYHALLANNDEGLLVLLNVMNELCKDKNDLVSLVNQRNNNDATLLHIASSKNKVKVINVLIEHSANIESKDTLARTPLFEAVSSGSVEATELLLSRGADPNVLDVHGLPAMLFAANTGKWEIIRLLSEKVGWDMNCHYFGKNMLSRVISSSAAQVDTRPFNFFIDRHVTLHQGDEYGVSATHLVLTSRSPVYLREILHRDPCLLKADAFKWPNPMLWEMFEGPKVALPRATKRIWTLRHYLNKEALLKLSDLSNSGSHTLLCDAVRNGATDAVVNFLKIGASIEHQCQEHGTLLAASISQRQLAIVKYLVREGADVLQSLGELRKCGIGATHECTDITRWLLVERHIEQPKISSGAFDDRLDSIVPWSGIGVAQVPLKWEWRQRRRETMLEYATRRRQILLDLRGEVV